jgi:putative transposase
MLVRRGYKTELDPNDKQRTLLARHAGTARYAYNWGLHMKIEALRDHKKLPSAMDLHKRLNVLKKNELSWDVRGLQVCPAGGVEESR